MKYKACIFDLDGTLVNTIADIAGAVNRALWDMAYPSHPVESYYSFVGMGWRHVCAQALPEDARNDAVIDTLCETALACYSRTPVQNSMLYPGISELISSLVQRKIKTAVVTNKPHSLAQAVLGNLFPPASFNAIHGELPGVPCKPDPASTWDILIELDVQPRQAVFVGDSDIDMETAIAANCYGVGVSWGFQDTETLVGAGARRIINAPGELLEIIDEARM